MIDPRFDQLHPIDEFTRLRIEWMQLLGHDWQVIDASLRFDRPQSVNEEQYLLESVKRLLAAEQVTR